MTPAPEKAALIPADVQALAESAIRRHYASSPYDVLAFTYVRKHVDTIARAILADREARPSLPDSREERIREEAAEDERDRLRLLAHQEAFEAESPACRRLYLIEAWLSEKGGQLPAERSRLRGEVS